MKKDACNFVPDYASNSSTSSVSKHTKRDIVNAILYVARGGIQWRMLPKDFPPWGTVYDHYRNWCMREVWQQALNDLTALHRRKQERDDTPSYGIIRIAMMKITLGAIANV